jgi:uncharacterized protein
MFLVDTNVWLELLLERENAGDVRRFLEQADATLIAISEFSLYSIGIILCRLGKDALFEDFVDDTLEGAVLPRVLLENEDFRQLLAVRRAFGLDFDDGYQYVAAGKQERTIVSYDSDFDRTPRGRKTPAQALLSLHA